MFGKKQKQAELKSGDAKFLSEVRAAQVMDDMSRATWTLYLMAIAVIVAIAWASTARVDEITRADGRVVPDGKEQVIASLEGGILRELFVREGMQVQEGQELAQLDPTRFESQQNEGQVKRAALRGTVARLTAEANGRALQFPSDVSALSSVVESETDAYNARKRALDEAVRSNSRSIELVMKELGVLSLIHI